MQRSIIAPAERVTNLRWGMLALVAAFILAPSVDGGWLLVGGWIDLAGFAGGAIVAQLPAGWLLDRYGVRRIGALGGGIWVVGTLAAAFGGTAAVTAASVVIGAAASVFFPLAIKATASWFPRTERGRATAVVVVAANVGTALLFTPLGVPAVADAAHLIGIAVAAVVTIVFALAYRDADDARVTYAERTFITAGGAQPVVVGPPGAAFGALVRRPATWVGAIAFGAIEYAVSAGGPHLWSGPLGAVNLIASLLLGGVLVDALAGAGAGAERVRLVVLAAGSLCGCALAGVTAGGVAGGIAATVATCGVAAAEPVAWALPGFAAPPGGAGMAAAIFGLAATIGTLAPAWSPADVPGAAAAAAIGAVLWAILVRIERGAAPV